MTTLSFKQVESNHGKRGLCERGCNWIKFSHFLNFRYRKYVIIVFFNSNSDCLYTPHARRKTFVLMFFQELPSLLSAEKSLSDDLEG